MSPRYVAGAILVAAVACAASVIVWPMVRHNRHLGAVGKALEDIDHPKNSELLDSATDIGLLRGNGNHCDYVAVELRSTSENWEDLVMHYRKVKTSFDLDLWDLKPGASGHQMNGFGLPNVVEEFRSRNAVGDRIYVVFLMDLGEPPEGDPRCY